MKPDQESVRMLLTDTVALLCKNGLRYDTDLRVQGLLGITVDGNDVFIVHIDECFSAAGQTGSSELVAESSSASAVVPVNEPTATLTSSDEQDAEQNDKNSKSNVTIAVSSGNHRQRRKQSSPRRDRRSFCCQSDCEAVDGNVIQVKSEPSSSVNCEESVQSEINQKRAEIENQTSNETWPVTEQLKTEVTSVKKLTDFHVKTEDAPSDDGSDVIFVSADNDRQLSADAQTDLDMLQLQAQAELMAANWLSGLTSAATGLFGNQHTSMPENIHSDILSGQYSANTVICSGRDIVSEASKLFTHTSAGCLSGHLPPTSSLAQTPASADNLPVMPEKRRSKKFLVKQFMCDMGICRRAFFRCSELYRHQREKHGAHYVRGPQQRHFHYNYVSQMTSMSGTDCNTSHSQQTSWK